MSIVVVGINHKTAPVTLREKIYFSTDKIALYLQDVLNRGHAHEAVLISTCNRSELYCDTDDIGAIRDWFCSQGGNTSELESATYIYRDEEAVAHIMQVACGLDSMVVGEPQILGQLKEAFSESCAAGAVDTLFHRLFQQVFAVAKDIRTTTAIGACPVSVASASVHFARQQITDFARANIVLIGAGDTTELLLRYLKQHLSRPTFETGASQALQGERNLTLVNRSTEKALALAEEFGGRVYELDRLGTALANADIVFSSTASVVPLVSKSLLAEIMRDRNGKPMMLMDLAVPRDIDPAVAELPGVSLFCIDDLKAIIERNRHGREHAADKAYEMVRMKSAEFVREWKSFDKVANTIRAYRGQIEDICQAELHKARQQLQQGVNPDLVLQAFAHAFTNKLLHAPSVQLRQAGAEGRFELLKFAKQLFAIPDPEAESL